MRFARRLDTRTRGSSPKQGSSDGANFKKKKSDFPLVERKHAHFSPCSFSLQRALSTPGPERWPRGGAQPASAQEATNKHVCTSDLSSESCFSSSILPKYWTSSCRKVLHSSLVSVKISSSGNLKQWGSKAAFICYHSSQIKNELCSRPHVLTSLRLNKRKAQGRWPIISFIRKLEVSTSWGGPKITANGTASFNSGLHGHNTGPTAVFVCFVFLYLNVLNIYQFYMLSLF